jgi:hypothetical protein
MNKKNYLIMMLLILGLVFSFPGAASAVLFQDNFDSGASIQWGNESGSWTTLDSNGIQTGVYFANNPSNSPFTYTSVPFNLSDFTVDVDVINVKDGGIWLRSSRAADGTISGVLLVTGGESGTYPGLYWHRFVNGVDQGKTGYVNLGFTLGQDDPHIRIVVSGNLYAAYVNGSSTPATTLDTNLFSSGLVALYDFNAYPNQSFDNFVLTPLPPAILLFGSGLLGFAALRRRKRTRIS